MWLRLVFRLVLVLTILSTIGIGLVDYLKNIDENECSMTWMRQAISIIPVSMPKNVQNQFPLYNLFLYCEGVDCHNFERMKFTKTGHMPILFITGNADSHKQVRSLASVAAYKGLKAKYAKRNIRLHFFTVYFNEELSGLYGPVLDMQTNYVKHCIKHIMSLFQHIQPEQKRPTNVLIVGNSMGGVVARGLFSPSDQVDFDPSVVNTIITQATPHLRPVVNVDYRMAAYYERINSIWLNKTRALDDVLLVSLYGGNRDILVRSGLSNVNEWTPKTSARVLSTLSLTMPHVWRSIDHRCMAWCRELVMSIDRALFNLIHPDTDQFTFDRTQRERVFKYHFSRNFAQSNASTIRFDPETVKITRLEGRSSFQLNEFTDERRLVWIKLDEMLSEADSLFLYTNLDQVNSFVACKQFDDYECTESVDLMYKYGRSIPPYLENAKEQTLRTLNVNDLRKTLVEQGYSTMLINIPQWPAKLSVKNYQLIIRLDWYRKEDRFKRIETGQIIVINDQSPVFTRYYLPSLTSTWQAYNLNGVDSGSCGQYLGSLFADAKQSLKPLSSSCVMAQFYEPVSQIQVDNLNEQIVHSQAIQGKSKNLTLRLTLNHPDELLPYVDLLKFDVKHLVHVKSRRSEAECHVNHRFRLEFNPTAALGQIVRFYIILIPAFIVVILQLYDFWLLNLSEEQSSGLNSVYFLNMFNYSFGNHVKFSVLLTGLCYLVSFAGTDYQQLTSERIYFGLLPFVLYWFAYGVLNVVCLVQTSLNLILSYAINKIVLKCVPILASGAFSKFLFVAHVIITCVMGFFSSTLGLCSLFYAIVINLARHNPLHSSNNKQKLDYSSFVAMQTRELLVYCLLILNLPGLIVWIKSTLINDAGVHHQIRPMQYIMGDTGLPVAYASIVIYVAYYVNANLGNLLNEKYFSVNRKLLSFFIVVNALFSVFFSTINLYRLQYFICLHLILMFFYPIKVVKIKAD